MYCCFPSTGTQRTDCFCLATQARSAEVVSLSHEVAELMERVEAAEAAADRYEAKYRSSKAELQQTQASSAHQSSELEELSEALACEQAAARSSQEAVEQLSTKLSALQVKLKGLLCCLQQHSPNIATYSYIGRHTISVLQTCDALGCSRR